LALIDDQIGSICLNSTRFQNYRHNPTVPIELIGNALFLPLTQSYARTMCASGTCSRHAADSAAARSGEGVSQRRDPIFVSTAISENEGNIDLSRTDIAKEIPAGRAEQ